MSDKPASTEISKFLSVFEKLCAFEAQHRLIRNWGCFDDERVPIPEVVKVVEWLTREAANEQQEGK